MKRAADSPLVRISPDAATREETPADGKYTRPPKRLRLSGTVSDRHAQPSSTQPQEPGSFTRDTNVNPQHRYLSVVSLLPHKYRYAGSRVDAHWPASVAEPGDTDVVLPNHTIHSPSTRLRERTAFSLATNSRMHRSRFRAGLIVNVPIHAANLNPKLDLDKEGRHVVETCEGWVYTKRRPMVIMWVHRDAFFALPMFTHTGRGIQGFPRDRKEEYVTLKQEGDTNFVNHGSCPELVVAETKHRLDPNSALWLAGGSKVHFKEDIRITGSLGTESHRRLMVYWRTLADKAADEAYRMLDSVDRTSKKQPV